MKPNKQLTMTLLFVFCHLALTHQIKTIKLEEQTIKGKTSVNIPIKFPFDKVFTIQTTIAADKRLINKINPTIHLQTQKVHPLPNHAETSMMQQLRTRQMFNFKHLIVCDEYLVAFLKPNIVMFLKEDGNTFEVKNKFGLQQIQKTSVTKMYKYKQNKVLLYVEDLKIIFLLGKNIRVKLKLQEQIKLAHLHYIANNKFITAQYGNGISLYQISNDTLSRKMHFSLNDLLKKGGSIEDISYNQKDDQLYILDSKSGVYSFQFNETEQKIDKLDTIIQVSGCQSMDYIHNKVFVLTCSITLPFFIIEAVKAIDPTSNEPTFIKKNPVYSTCYFNDIFVRDNFYMAFHDTQIDVFWNSLKTGLYETQNVRENANFLGLETFAVKGQFLYTIQSGVLVKYRMIQSNGGAYFYSQIPVSKTITVEVPGPCQKSTITANKQFSPIECIYEKKVNLEISQDSTEDNQKTSATVGIILIMIVVILLLICICLKKYNGLEEHARKILLSLKKKENAHQKFSL